MQNQLITAVDAYPGAGKTHYFRSVALKMLTSDNPSHVLIYAAPTKLLCEEVRTALIQSLDGHPASKNIHSLWITKEDEARNHFRRFKEEDLLSDDGKVSSKLDRLLGITKDLDGKTRPLPAGSVILTTHAAFMKISFAKPLIKTWVFFDEARQCLGMQRKLSIPRLLSIPILWLFRLEWQLSDPEDPGSRKEKSKLVKITNFPTRQDVDHALHENRVMLNNNLTATQLHRLDGKQSGRDILLNETTKLNPLRTDLYLLAPNEEDFLKSVSASDKSYLSANQLKVGKNDNLVVYPFHKPSGLFTFYDRTTILSAFFKDSQMYHSLKEQYTIVSLIDPNPEHLEIFEENPWLQSAWKACAVVRKRNRILQENTSKRLLITPLLTTYHDYDTGADVPERVLVQDIQKLTTEERLTKQLLNSGMIIKQSYLPKIKALVEQSELDWDGWDVVRRLWEHWFILYRETPMGGRPVYSESLRTAYKSELPPVELEVLTVLYRNLKKFMFDAKGEILFPARKLALLAADHLKRLKVDSKALLVLNSASRGSRIPYLLSSNYIKSRTEWVSPIIEDTSALIREGFQEVFDIPNATKLHGLNTWKDKDHIVHLAAMNPSTEMESVFKKILPEYRASSDFVLENLVQTLYRTSLRNPEGTSKVHLFVTNTSIAKSLFEKLNVKLVVSNATHSGPDASLCELRFQSEIRKRNWKSTLSKNKTKYSSSNAQAIRKARSGIHYYEKLSVAGKLTAAQRKKLEAHVETLRVLKAKSLPFSEGM